MEIAVNATYVKLTGKTAVGASTGGGIRGKIRGFSKASRKRLLDWLNKIRAESVSSALFVTLTYPDLFPEDPQKWKRDLDVLLKRLRRKHTEVAVVWRLEWALRLSGRKRGRMAPHFHLLVLNLPRLDPDWLAVAWYEVVDSKDERHLEAGTRVERVRSRRGIMHYASKYLGKEAANPESWTGRAWGIYGRDRMPFSVAVYRLAWRQFYRVRRVLRAWLVRHLGLRASWATNLGAGLTAYMTDSAADRLLAWAVPGATPMRFLPSSGKED